LLRSIAGVIAGLSAKRRLPAKCPAISRFEDLIARLPQVRRWDINGHSDKMSALPRLASDSFEN
jgi:hypothetical protein